LAVGESPTSVQEKDDCGTARPVVPWCILLKGGTAHTLPVVDMKIRNIPEDVSRRIKALANLEGVSLREKLIELITAELAKKGM
jgi:hypothetical protein